MLTIMLGGENICNPLDGQMDALIDTYVSVHGEHKRDIISERLHNTTFIFVPRMVDGLENIRNLYLDKRNALTKEFFEKLGYPSLGGVMSVGDVLSLKVGLERDWENPITALELDQFCKKLEIYDEVQDYRIKIGAINPSRARYKPNDESHKFLVSEGTKQKLMEFFNKAEELDKVLQTRRNLNELALEYTSIVEKMGEIDKADLEIKKQMADDIDELFIEGLSRLLYRSKSNLVQAYSKGGLKRLLSAYKFLLDRGREKFADEMTMTEQAKYDCLALFQEMGVCYGSSLEMYAKDINLMNCLFDASMIERYNEIQSSYENDRAIQNPFFTDAVRTIESLDMWGGNLVLVNQVYKYMFHNNAVGAEVMHYLTKEGELRTICLLPIGPHLDRVTLLHEGEHIIESSIIGMIVKCGIESYGFVPYDEDYNGKNLPTSDNRQMCGERKNRPYEVLNETMVQMFAYMLLRKAEECGLMAGNPQVGSCWHAKMVRLFDGFVEYSDKLSDVRLDNDGHAFSKAFGTANILIMNEVANAYYKSVIGSGIKYSDFLTHMRINTGQDLEEVDFLNLPDDLEWSESDKEFLTQHILLAKVLENLRSSMAQKNKHTESESGALN